MKQQYSTAQRDETMAAAKRRFTEAAMAALAGDPGAPELARIALEDVERARGVTKATAEPSPPWAHNAHAMRGIVRDARFATRRFMARCEDTYAAFHVAKGGFPRQGEFIRWEDEPCDFVIGESSGTMVVDLCLFGLSLVDARAFMAAV